MVTGGRWVVVRIDSVRTLPPRFGAESKTVVGCNTSGADWSRIARQALIQTGETAASISELVGAAVQDIEILYIVIAALSFKHFFQNYSHSTCVETITKICQH